jgi:hypothetical protein
MLKLAEAFGCQFPSCVRCSRTQPDETVLSRHEESGTEKTITWLQNHPLDPIKLVPGSLIRDVSRVARRCRFEQ